MESIDNCAGVEICNIESLNSCTSEKSNWLICSKKVPCSEIIYFTQVLLIFIVVIVCLFNLTTLNKTESKNYALWSSLLSGCLGYLLPSPRLKKKKSSI